jgi:hypothetical protein
MIDQLKSEPIHFVVKVSFLELYNEDIRDMLSPSTDEKTLQIREDANGVFVAGLTEHTVSSRLELEQILLKGIPPPIACSYNIFRHTK